ncbi:MAG: DUF2125 domain-containing protein [Pararhodobacter sp.]
MRAIKGLTLLAVLATLGWGGYWFAGSRALDRAVTSALARDPAISAESHVIRGFPNRFDLTLDQPRVALPGGEWSAPFVQFFALTYRLNHLIAVFAQDQALRINGVEALLHAEDLRASVVMEPGLDLPLDRVSLVGRDVVLTLNGDLHRMERLRLASRRLDATTHEIVALAEAVFPAPALMDALDPQRDGPRRFDLLRMDSELAFDRPLDRHLFDGPQPRLTGIALTGGRAAWEGVEIALSGRLTPDRAGALSGEMNAAVTGWRVLLEVLRTSGSVDDQFHALLAQTMETMAAGDEVLEIPLSVVAGEVRLGPLALGLLPRVLLGGQGLGR